MSFRDSIVYEALWWADPGIYKPVPANSYAFSPMPVRNRLHPGRRARRASINWAPGAMRVVKSSIGAAFSLARWPVTLE